MNDFVELDIEALESRLEMETVMAGGVEQQFGLPYECWCNNR
jgi:hypothetical protein